MLRKIVIPLFLSTLLLVLTLLFLHQTATATLEEGYAPSTVINVNTTADAIANDGFCSLREAAIAANTNSASGGMPGECPAGSGVDTINLPTGAYNLSLFGIGNDTPFKGDIDISSELSIVGAGVLATIVDGGHFDRVFEITTTGKATISNLALSGGLDNGWGGGGISNDGMLTMTHVLVNNNSSSVNGGGLQNNGTGQATLSNVSFENNSAETGGGIANYGSLTMNEVSLDFGWAAGNGGGLWNSGTASLNDVNISFNIAGFNGGGIENQAVLTLTRVTVNDNMSSDGNGGGIYQAGVISLLNVTLSENSADNGFGGGFYRASGVGTLTNVTIANNFASLGGGIYAMASGLSLKNTLVVLNTSTNCHIDNGTLLSLGNNLSSDLTCNLAFNQPGDQTNILDPQIGILASNGGKTKTHALKPGSLAIDRGNNTNCPVTDQRGFRRPLDGDRNGTATCDVGAFEKLMDIYLPLIRQ